MHYKLVAGDVLANDCRKREPALRIRLHRVHQPELRPIGAAKQWHRVQGQTSKVSVSALRTSFSFEDFRIQHSRVAIIKPQRKTADQALEEVEEAIKRDEAGGGERRGGSVGRGYSPFTGTSPRHRSPSPRRLSPSPSRRSSRERSERRRERTR